MEINGQLHGNYMLKINTLLRLRLAEELTLNYYYCPLNKHRRCERTQPGVTPPAPERSEDPPGQAH